MAVPKPLLTEFGIHHRLESCDVLNLDNLGMNVAAGIGAECKKYILPGSLRRSGIYLG